MATNRSCEYRILCSQQAQQSCRAIPVMHAKCTAPANTRSMPYFQRRNSYVQFNNERSCPRSPRVVRLCSPPIPSFLRSQAAPATLNSPLPSTQPHNKTSRVVTLLARFCRKRHDRFCALLRCPTFLDDIHDLLIACLVSHTVCHEDHEGVFGRGKLGDLTLWFCGDAHALGRHVPEGARVG